MDKDFHIKLLHRISVDNDESAFKELYVEYYDKLFRFAIHLVRNEEWSEEIVSDIFFNIWQNKRSLDEVVMLDAYLYKAVRNKSLHYIEKARRHPVTEQLSVTIEFIPDQDTPESLMMTNELNIKLQEAIESLPDRCRIIFKLVWEDKLKYKEIAEILNISVRTIDAQMAIAMKKIKQVIEGYVR